MPRITIRERLFPLHEPADVDALLARGGWIVVFKAGTSDRTFDAWAVVEALLAPRRDVAIGLIRLPVDRPASERIAALTEVPHRSPQVLLLGDGAPRFHLNEDDIAPVRLGALLAEHLPAEPGPPVRNETALSVEPYRALLRAFVGGELREEPFQWAYLERLEQDASWRDEETFDALNALFDNPWDRDVRPARLVAIEFQGQLAGGREPLRDRAVRVLDRLAMIES